MASVIDAHPKRCPFSCRVFINGVRADWRLNSPGEAERQSGLSWTLLIDSTAFCFAGGCAFPPLNRDPSVSSFRALPISRNQTIRNGKFSAWGVYSCLISSQPTQLSFEHHLFLPLYCVELFSSVRPVMLQKMS